MESAPKWFVPVAVLGLLWNLMGAAMYLMDVMMTPEDVAKLDATMQAFNAARPTWLIATFAVAVWVGVVGSLGMVLKKGWATGALAVSFAAVVLQNVWIFGMSGISAPGAVVGIQATVLVISVALLLLSRKAGARGWIA